jgi:hypothetical protein
MRRRFRLPAKPAFAHGPTVTGRPFGSRDIRAEMVLCSMTDANPVADRAMRKGKNVMEITLILTFFDCSGE